MALILREVLTILRALIITTRKINLLIDTDVCIIQVTGKVTDEGLVC